MTMQKRRFKKLACHDELTYEVLRMLQVFGPLSIPSLYKRCSQICKQNELMISEEYFREFLLSEMEKRRYITIKKEIVTGYVDRGKHRFMQDAFWIFLEFVEGMDMESVIDGPDPAQVSFQRNNALYHIVRCDSDGSLDYGPIKSLVAEMREYQNPYAAEQIPDRFILVYSSRDLMLRSPIVLDVPTLKAVVEYPNGGNIASLYFSKV